MWSPGGRGGVLGAGCHVDQCSSSRKKSLAGMKRAQAEADGDSDAEDPGAPAEAEGVSQQEEEEDEAEYFRQAVGEEPDEGVWQAGVSVAGHHGLVCPCALVVLTQSLPTDMFPKAAKWRRPAGPPGKKRRVKEQKPDRGSDRRPPKAKGRHPGAQAKVGPRGAARDHRRGRPWPPKRVA